MFGLNEESEISRQKYTETMRKTFDSKDDKMWENVWDTFARNRDTCNVGVIIKALQKYES